MVLFAPFKGPEQPECLNFESQDADSGPSLLIDGSEDGLQDGPQSEMK